MKETNMTKLSKFYLLATILISLAVLLFICTAHAEEYTDEAIVNAIRKAEGSWTYGIKSIKCATNVECRKICLRTVQNNKKRFMLYGFKKYPDYLSFLASKYAPIGAGNDPSGLNKNWLKNVKWFLAHGDTK